MVQKHYSDYFSVPQDYKANMTREAINETPETWLNFYPHQKYVEFLNTLLDGIKNGSKSVWLTGNYGTGKSNAALVTQKLFMDNEERVKRWFEQYQSALSNCESLEQELFAHRKDGTLVVYDYNASGVGPNEDFLVRLEKGIIAALSELGMSIPAKANLDIIIQRLRREGSNFFATRDSIQSELAYLNADITTVEQLVDTLSKEHETADAPTRLLDDVQKVFHKDNIYLNVDVQTFRQWIASILSTNNLKRVIYIFDEFSEFIDANKDQLKTFEDVTENPGINKFFLIPVTHLDIKAFWSENSSGAKKASDRFHFRNLQMPNDTAFKLAASAMKDNTDPSIAAEWKEERNNLWSNVSSIADMFSPNDVSRQSFYDILPIHPMAAFLLKFLSESARSNQRSIFEYLKGSADGHEFQDFIRTGGPDIPNKQYLTVDYLWKYFIERDDLGLNKEITDIRSEYERIKNREFQNRSDDDEDIRVLKTVLLFCLLSRLNPDGHERLQPTVRNIELSFQGDGAIVGVDSIIKNLAEKHCFSVVNGNIELFTTSVGDAELQAKMAEFDNKFHELLSEKVKAMLEEHTKSARATNSANRFDIRVSDVGHTTLTNITASIRDKYSKGQNKDDGSVCLWFVVAKNQSEQLQIPEKINSILSQLRDHRILMFTFPKVTFCDSNSNLWNEYVKQYAQYMLENDGTAKDQIKKSLERLEQEWFDEIKKSTQDIRVYEAKDGQIVPSIISWGALKALISGYVRKTLPNCVDYLTPQITAFGTTGLKSWAMAGIQFEAASGQYKQLVNGFKHQGISDDNDWFAQNPKHPLSEIYSLFKKKIANTVDKGTNLSIRKVYIELKRAPFGMRYNVLSAFVLGFTLRDILTKNYQWTNEQMTKPLDAETLAEIIESVVKDDGQDKIKGEKLICRLSKEEKAFVEKIPRMFRFTAMADATVESVLLQVQNSLEQISERVPLWILPEYIRSVGDSKFDLIDEILCKICTAGSISSKGKTEERSNAIKDIGAVILNNDNIIDAVAIYIKPENFVTAFQLYIDKKSPALKELAESIGDISHDYCRSILDKVAPTAGLLWKPADISKEIDETLSEYEVIRLVKPLIGLTGFVQYKNVLDTLCSAVTQTNKLPKAIIESTYPVLSTFLSELQSGGKASAIKDSLAQNSEIIRKLFFDVSKAEPIKLLKIRLHGIDVTDTELLNVLNSMPNGFSTNETMFLDGINSKIEDYRKQSVVQKLKSEWEHFSGTKTPDEWAFDNKLPARFALSGLPEADELLKAIEQPDTFASTRLAELLEILKEVVPISIADCQKVFITEAIPQRYVKFNINLSSLLGFLCGKYGKQPNNWPIKLDILDFIDDQYQNTFAPQIVDKIRRKPADDIKQKLLLLAQKNPDIGLLFWE